MRCSHVSCFLLIVLVSSVSSALDFLSDFGARPNDQSLDARDWNRDALSRALQESSNQTLTIPRNNTFYLHHGVFAERVKNIHILLEGVLRFQRNFSENIFRDKQDPSRKRPSPCIQLAKCRNVTLTSSHKQTYRDGGMIHGSGWEYWGVPLVGYLQVVEHRPILFQVNDTEDLLMENIVFKDAPYWTVLLENVNRVEIRYISIMNRRTTRPGHGIVDMSAFNTDGIDVSGHNVHVHDVEIWTQDDCIAVKVGTAGKVYNRFL